LHYHITTGIGIGTRIGIGAGKKYRVSEVSTNPGIGLSLAQNIRAYLKSKRDFDVIVKKNCFNCVEVLYLLVYYDL